MAERHGGRLSTSNLQTLFYEVMAVMNSRPLEVVDDGQVPLTPNTLLIIESKIILPAPGNFEDTELY